MKVSIITIVLNDEENIEKTILSVLNQKDINLEHIVIDGGSTDGTLNSINKYENNIDIFISEKDEGIVDAFNKGIKLATGEIICILNSGDWLEDNVLHTIATAFDNYDVVYGDVQYWQDNKKDYKYTAKHQLLNKFMSVNHPSVFIRKSTYEKYGLFDENFKVAMDYELMLRYYVSHVKFMYIPILLANMSLGGVSDLNWKLAYKEAYEIRKKYLGDSFILYIGYLFQVLKRHVSNLLVKIGLERIRVLYKQRFSKVKKEML